MTFLIVLAVMGLYFGSIYAAVVYTRKALEAAHQVKLAETPPQKRAYNRKSKVVTAKMEPATQMTESGMKAMNGGNPYKNGHAASSDGIGIFE